VLPGEGDEVEVECCGGGADAQAGVDDTGGNSERDLEVRLGFGARNRVRDDPGVLEQLVEQDAGACPKLAFGDPEVPELADAIDSTGVSGW
jgi:hypothetical protein